MTDHFSVDELFDRWVAELVRVDREPDAALIASIETVASQNGWSMQEYASHVAMTAGCTPKIKRGRRVRVISASGNLDGEVVSHLCNPVDETDPLIIVACGCGGDYDRHMAVPQSYFEGDEDHGYEYDERYEEHDYSTTNRQQAQEEALEKIEEVYGKFDKTTGPDGSHYVAASPFKADGLVCANCVFYEGPRGCEIVEGDIDPDAVCKFWIIPNELLEDEHEREDSYDYDMLGDDAVYVLGALTAATNWDPDLHPRAKDGKFINVLGFINAMINGKWTRAQVKAITPDSKRRGQPDITVDVIDRDGNVTGTAVVKPRDVTTSARAKAFLQFDPTGDRVAQFEGGNPISESGEDDWGRSAMQSLTDSELDQVIEMRKKDVENKVGMSPVQDLKFLEEERASRQEASVSGVSETRKIDDIDWAKDSATGLWEGIDPSGNVVGNVDDKGLDALMRGDSAGIDRIRSEFTVDEDVLAKAENFDVDFSETPDASNQVEEKIKKLLAGYDTSGWKDSNFIIAVEEAVSRYNNGAADRGESLITPAQEANALKSMISPQGWNDHVELLVEYGEVDWAPASGPDAGYVQDTAEGLDTRNSVVAIFKDAREGKNNWPNQYNRLSKNVKKYQEEEARASLGDAAWEKLTADEQRELIARGAATGFTAKRNLREMRADRANSTTANPVQEKMLEARKLYADEGSSDKVLQLVNEAGELRQAQKPVAKREINVGANMERINDIVAKIRKNEDAFRKGLITKEENEAIFADLYEQRVDLTDAIIRNDDTGKFVEVDGKKYAYNARLDMWYEPDRKGRDLRYPNLTFGQRRDLQSRLSPQTVEEIEAELERVRTSNAAGGNDYEDVLALEKKLAAAKGPVPTPGPTSTLNRVREDGYVDTIDAQTGAVLKTTIGTSTSQQLEALGVQKLMRSGTISNPGDAEITNVTWDSSVGTPGVEYIDAAGNSQKYVFSADEAAEIANYVKTELEKQRKHAGKFENKFGQFRKQRTVAAERSSLTREDANQIVADFIKTPAAKEFLKKIQREGSTQIVGADSIVAKEQMRSNLRKVPKSEYTVAWAFGTPATGRGETITVPADVYWAMAVQAGVLEPRAEPLTTGTVLALEKKLAAAKGYPAGFDVNVGAELNALAQQSYDETVRDNPDSGLDPRTAWIDTFGDLYFERTGVTLTEIELQQLADKYGIA